MSEKNKSIDSTDNPTELSEEDLKNVQGGEGTVKKRKAKDFLLGGPGNDSLLGGPGNDSLIGGPGNDSLVGS